ncbi:MAG: hypothetical protein NT030_05720 [Candidatus Saganbacteria bacterium]|nr:hypothetical protein [Candidatus Saganbacteria bacterium]
MIKGYGLRCAPENKAVSSATTGNRGAFKKRKAIVIDRVAAKDMKGEPRLDLKLVGLIDINLPGEFEKFENIYFDSMLKIVKPKVEEAAREIAENTAKSLLASSKDDDPIDFFNNSNVIFFRSLKCMGAINDLSFGWLNIFTFSPQKTAFSDYMYQDLEFEPLFALLRQQYNIFTQFPVEKKLTRREEGTLLYLMINPKFNDLFGRLYGVKIQNEPHKTKEDFWVEINDLSLEELERFLQFGMIRSKNVILSIYREALLDRDSSADRLYKKLEPFIEKGALIIADIHSVDFKRKGQ